MNQHANHHSNHHSPDTDLLDIAPLLAVTREYLGLNTESPTPAAAPPVNLIKPPNRNQHMNHYRTLARTLLLATGLGAFAAAPAFADTGCPAMMEGHEMHYERHAKRMEEHHKQLHDALKLTAEQEPGWKKLMESEKAKPAPGSSKSEDWSKLSAPERAEKMLEFSKLRQERMSEHVAALKAFYATLSTEQKKTFEDFHSGRRGGMRGKSAPRPPSPDKAPAKS